MIASPAGPEDITLELLMANQTHMGHHTSLWNPSNSRYIYGERQGIHIISLEETAAHLRRAARVVEEVAYCGGLMLFVGTRKGQVDTVVRAAKMAGACHLYTKWTPGLLTNRDIMNAGSDIKVVNELDQTLDGFDDFIQEARPLVPDLVICMNPLENFTLLYECTLLNIPTIGVIDTNADPTKVTYTIPANDDSHRSINLIAGVLGRAGQQGQRRRLEAAKNGIVEWQNPTEVRLYTAKTLKQLADEEALARAAQEAQDRDKPRSRRSPAETELMGELDMGLDSDIMREFAAMDALMADTKKMEQEDKDL